MSLQNTAALRDPSAVVAPRSATRARFLREIERIGLPLGPGPEGVVTADEIAPLPATVRRYLQFMGVVGRPRAWSMRIGWGGAFRMKPGGPWLPCEAWQYSTRLGVARIFRMRLRFGGVLPVVVRDDYLRGGGHMRAKLLDVISLADEDIEEIAVGELVTYLSDAVSFSPSMLLGPGVRWVTVDEASFDVELTDAGRAVKGRVRVDERGTPVDFETTDRFYQAPDDPAKRWVRTRWTTPIDGFEQVLGQPIPARGQAVWHLPGGPFAYADFRVLPGSFAENVAPGA
jgi:hypothetical protein